jgi:hypothetical protein
MKKIRILTLVASAAFVFASQTASALVTFGVKGGMGVSLDRTDVPGGSIPAYFFMGGASAEFGLGPVGLLTEAFYSMNKTRIGVADTYAEIGTNSILVPVQIKVSMMGVLSFTGGAYWNYGIGDVTSRLVVAGTEAANTSSSYDSLGYNRSSFGAIAGLGLGLPLGVTTLTAEARLRYGLTDLDSSSTVSVKTMAVDLLVGFTF